jgi:hypothetical protein
MPVVRDKALIRRLLLSGVLAAGFVPVWGVLGLWAFTVINDLEGNLQQPPRLQIQPDGTPLIVDRTPGKTTFHDLDGNSVPPPEESAQWGRGLTLLPARKPLTGDVDDWAVRIRAFADGALPATYWYFMTDGRSEGSAYFVGYDSESKRRVGFIGTAGFREQQLPADERFPFSGSAAGSHVITVPTPAGGTARHPAYYTPVRTPDGFVSPHDLYVLGPDQTFYHIDMLKRTVETALQGIPLSSGGVLLVSRDTTQGPVFTPIVRSEDAVVILDPHGRELRRFAIPEPLRDRDLSFTETSPGGAVMLSGGQREGTVSSVYHIFHITPDGRWREATVTLPGIPIHWLFRMGFGAVLPSPAVLAGMLGVGRTWQLLDNGADSTVTAALARTVTEFWPSLTTALVVAMGLAVLSYRRLARYGASIRERLVWTLFVLFFGLPGWIGYRFGRNWPTLEACPSCRTIVPRDREACSRCADAFPRPALKGTEVFA